MNRLTQGAREHALEVAPVTPIPDRLAVGGGTALFVDGRCIARDGRIKRLDVVFDGRRVPADGWGMPPPEQTEGASYWWAIVTIEPVEEPHLAWIELSAELVGGGEATARVGTIELLPELDLPRPRGGDDDPEVAICMTTHRPPVELFRRQIDSIREQTHTGWRCFISDDASGDRHVAEIREVLGDDPRFELATHRNRLGFYRNFERALALAPPGSRYVALADQDDRWHPEKLERLIAGIGPGARLVYSDMRIVSEEGEVISPTYWQFRRNNYEDFASLVIANTITGAASLFDRALLDDALPFPPEKGKAYHDHWIAQVALALGPVSYVDEPLYDYVQHGDAALGHLRANNYGIGSERGMARVARGLRRLRPRRIQPGWRIYYFDLVCRIAIAARTLELRLGDRLAPDRRRILARLDDAAPDVGWLISRSLRSGGASGATLGREAAMLRGIAWRRGAEVRKRYRGAARRAAPEAAPDAAGAPGGEALTPILVDYFSRDGSTVLMRLLASSPQIAVEPVYPFERKYFAYLWRWSQVLERGEWPEAEWGLPDLGSLDDLRDAWMTGPMPWIPRPLVEADEVGGSSLARTAFDLVWGEFSRRAAEATRRRHGSSAPVLYSAEKHMNTWRVPLENLPEARVIAVLRDPRDSFVSIRAFGDRAGSGFGGADAATEEGLLRHVIARQRERLRWIESLDPEAVAVVRYEDLVHDLDEVAARLGERLGVELDPTAVRADAETRERHRSAAGAQASIGRWRGELDPEVAARFERELGAELRALGFEA